MHLEVHYVLITPGNFVDLRASVDRLFPPSATIYYLMNSNEHGSRQHVHDDETLRAFFAHIRTGGQRYEQGVCVPGCVNVSLDGVFATPWSRAECFLHFPKRPVQPMASLRNALRLTKHLSNKMSILRHQMLQKGQ